MTLAHSHTPTYTIRTLCVNPVTTTVLQKLRYTKDPYKVFQCVSGTYREQQTHPMVFPCFLLTYPSTKSRLFCSSWSTPPSRKTRTQGGLTWHNHSRSNLALTNYSSPHVTRLMVCNWQCWRRWWQLTRPWHDHSHIIGFQNNHSTSNLTRVKWHDWQCWRRWWQHTVTHCCRSTLRSALWRLEH